MMTDRQFVRYVLEERVAMVVLDHPPVNAFNRQMMSELDGTLDELLANAEVKVIVVTGGGQMAFVAGADLGEINSLVQAGDLAEARAMLAQGQRVFMKIERAPKPIIAAINGVCLGGGLELALACHIRIAGDRVRLGQPEINLGLIPGWGGTQRLPRLVGAGKAIEMILTGDPITAQEAKAVGLINVVAPGDAVLRQAKGLALKLAAKSGVGLAAALEAWGGREMPLEAGLAVEMEAFVRLAGSADTREGVSAFLEKRTPQFRDQ
jgi:enoyl-CoA hydratase/carnithine racemase